MLKHTGLILPAHTVENRVMAIAWSSDGSTLAAALADNTIYTFHCRLMKHLIRVECSNSGVTKANHSVRDVAFSPDSTKLAVADARGAVHVHNIENDWTSDASVCNEFLQNSSVNCLVWSGKGPIIFGLDNGKIRASLIETEMTWTLYSTDSPTIAVSINDTDTGVLSSHVDGSIFHCSLTSDGLVNTANRILTRLTTPRVLAWAQDKILIGDRDGQVVFYDNRGKLLQNFDYSQESSAEKSSYACCATSKFHVAVGLRGKVHLYRWDEENDFWQETDSSPTSIVGTVTALALRKDGARLAIGGLHGVVAEFKVSDAEPTQVNVALSADKCPSRNVGMLIRKVDSNLVSEISLESDNGLPGSVIWPTAGNPSSESNRYFEKSFDQTPKLRRSMMPETPNKLGRTLLLNDTKDIGDSLLAAVEPINRSDIASAFSTWSDGTTDKANKYVGAKKSSKQIVPDGQVDRASSDVASNPEKSSFTMDFGSIMSSYESGDEIDSTTNDSAIASRTIRESKQRNAKTYRSESSDLFASTIPTPLTADGMLFQNLNEIPYDPTVDPPCWKSESLGKSRSYARTFCRNCGRLDVTMTDCPRCKNAYCRWSRHVPDENSLQTVISTPIRFTRQYTPEELRADFTLQLALLASLSPGLQRMLEQQMLCTNKDRSC